MARCCAQETCPRTLLGAAALAGPVTLVTALTFVGFAHAAAQTAPAAAPPTPATDSAAAFAEHARLASRSLMIAVARAGERIVAVGDRGVILFSDDKGATWTQASSVPTQDLLTGVCFLDSRHGIAVGHDEVILTTQDAGETWTRTHYAPEAQQPLLDVWCGQVGAAAATPGSNPTAAPVGTAAEASGHVADNPARAIAVGAYSVYFSSDDGGATWKESKFQAQQPPRKAEAVPSKHPGGSADSTGPGAGAGAGAAAPAGDASTDELGGGFHLNRIVAASNSRFYIAAEAGHLYRSDDSGGSWTELASPYQGSFFGVLPLADDALLAFGLRGNLFRSDNAGQSWQRIETGTVAMLDSGARLSDGSIAIVGLSGVVLVSRDGGKSFVLLQQDDRKGLSAVLGAGDGRVLTAGEGGVKLIQLEDSVARGALSVVGSAPAKAAASGPSRGSR